MRRGKQKNKVKEMIKKYGKYVLIFLVIICSYLIFNNYKYNSYISKFDELNYRNPDFPRSNLLVKPSTLSYMDYTYEKIKTVDRELLLLDEAIERYEIEVPSRYVNKLVEHKQKSDLLKEKLVKELNDSINLLDPAIYNKSKKEIDDMKVKDFNSLTSVQLYENIKNVDSIRESYLNNYGTNEEEIASKNNEVKVTKAKPIELDKETGEENSDDPEEQAEDSTEEVDGNSDTKDGSEENIACKNDFKRDKKSEKLVNDALLKILKSLGTDSIAQEEIGGGNIEFEKGQLTYSVDEIVGSMQRTAKSEGVLKKNGKYGKYVSPIIYYDECSKMFRLDSNGGLYSTS